MTAPVPPRFNPPDKPFTAPKTATGKRAPELVDVIFWRYEMLRAAGYPQDQALELAENRSVDLHEACDILAAGCLSELAVKILG